MDAESDHLVRGLTLADAVSLVIGTIIGTGIFLKTAVMTQPSPVEAGMGLLLITLGRPVYLYFRQRERELAAAEH